MTEILVKFGAFPSYIKKPIPFTEVFRTSMIHFYHRYIQTEAAYKNLQEKLHEFIKIASFVKSSATFSLVLRTFGELEYS